MSDNVVTIPASDAPQPAATAAQQAPAATAAQLAPAAAAPEDRPKDQQADPAAAAQQAGPGAPQSPPNNPPGNPPANPWGAQRQLRLGMLTIAVLVLGFGGWSMLAQIAGAVIAMGQVEVENNRQVVQHPDGGVVADVMVSEAQKVQAGDVLIRLNGTSLLSELAIVESQLYEAMARRARLEAERDETPTPVFPAELLAAAKADPTVLELMEGQRALFVTRAETRTKQVEQLEKRKQQIGAQIQGNDAQIAALNIQVELLQADLRDQESLLGKGLTQSSRVSALEREAAQLQGQIGGLQASRAENEGRATEVDLEILRMASLRREEASTELRDVGQKEVELMERRTALRERAAHLEIRAPVSGTVLGLKVTAPQSVVVPAEPLMYIIPQDRPLVITARVDPMHVDEVHVGQPVRLVFPALSSRTTPIIFGHLNNVSADVIMDEASKTSFYRAEILLDAGEREKLAQDSLLPGMPVQAFIATGERSPMAYLIKPFTDYFRTAMRES